MAATPYVPPLDELEFCLKEIGGLKDLLKFERFANLSEDLILAILEEGGKFSASVLSPLNAAGDRRGCAFSGGAVATPPGFREAYRLFADNGWNGIAVDTRLGGQGLPAILATAVAEMWHGANMAFSLCPLLTQGAIELISAHGSRELQQRFLPWLISGDWTGTMCMTEPQAGSDVGMIRATATPEGDHYRVRGAKIFITYGEHDLAENIVHMVLARLPDAPEGTKGLSLFLVPKFLVGAEGEIGERNDVTCVSIEHKMGIHASPTAALSFGEKEGAVGWLVGKPNGGIEAMFTMMNAARLAVGLEGVGLAGYASQLAHAYAGERVQGRDLENRPATLDRHAGVRRELLRMEAHVCGLRALAIYAARHMDIARHHPDAALRREAQARVDLLIPVMKAHGTDTAFAVISSAMQLHGGMGYIEETGLSQLLRDSRIAMIYEGANEIQALDLATRKLRLREGEALKQLISEIWEACTAFEKTENGALQAAAHAVRDAAKQLDVATIWLLQQHQDARDNPAHLRAIHYTAPAYLTLVGLTAQGYLLAVSAYKALKAGSYPEEFLSRKLRLAHFFALEALPETGGLCQRILRGDLALRVYDAG